MGGLGEPDFGGGLGKLFLGRVAGGMAVRFVKKAVRKVGGEVIRHERRWCV